MERFSNFNDPFYGINPFINPKRRKLGVFNYAIAIFKIPLLMITIFINSNFIRMLIKIKANKIEGKINVMASNCSSLFDIYILKYLTGIKNFYYVTKDGFVNVDTGKETEKLIKPCIIFPEGCQTNNSAILQFVRPVKIDHTCGIKYQGDCINLYGSFTKFLFHFLSARNSVNVIFKKTENLNDICQTSKLPQVSWSIQDKIKFMKEVNKSK